MEQRESDGNSEHEADALREASANGQHCASEENENRTSRFSTLSNYALNVLYNDDDDANSSEGATSEQMLPASEENDRTSSGADDPEEAQSTRDSSANPESLGKPDLGQYEPGQSSDDDQSALQGSGRQSRPSRIISREFKFLSKYSSNGYAEERTSSPVKEEPEEKQPEGTDVVEAIPSCHMSASIQQKMFCRVFNSEAANTPSSSDSEDDDCDGKVIPGAWTRTSFVYINENVDATSEENTKESPQSSSEQPQCFSIYPPGISDVEEENPDINQCESHDDAFESDIKDAQDTEIVRNDRHDSVSTTQSEQEFRTYFKGLKKTRILRNHSRSTAEMIKPRSSAAISQELVLKLNEGEKEFGFHVWGCAPIIVSTVEKGSAADRAGLKVGNVLLRINSFDISEASVNEAVDLLGKDSSEVKLGIGEQNLKSEVPLCCGYLIKQGGSMLKTWRKRWVELKADNCLYYYKNKGDLDPLGAVPVANYTVKKSTAVKDKFAFELTKYGCRTYYFIASSETEMSRWARAIKEASSEKDENSLWLDISSHNVSLPALAIRQPDCYGYLNKLGNCRKSWRYRYCVLKDGCLFYYINVNSPTAKGVAHLHGYSVSNSMPYNKPYGFMLVPPESDMRTFCFFANNPTEKERWVAAFKESLNKWVVQTR